MKGKPAISIREVLAKRKVKLDARKVANESRATVEVSKPAIPIQSQSETVKSAQSTLAPEKPTARTEATKPPHTIPKRSDKKGTPEEVRHVKLHMEYERFLEWMATPEQIRNPKTQKAFADQNKISEDTLSLWKRRDGFWTEWESRVRYSSLRDKIPAYLHAVGGKVMRDGSAQEMLVLLKYVLGWSDKSVFVDETPQRGELTEEQARAIAEAARLTGMQAVLSSQKEMEQAFLNSQIEPDLDADT